MAKNHIRISLEGFIHGVLMCLLLAPINNSEKCVPFLEPFQPVKVPQLVKA